MDLFKIICWTVIFITRSESYILIELVDIPIPRHENIINRLTPSVRCTKHRTNEQMTGQS